MRGRLIRGWARLQCCRMLRPGAAVILDVETTDLDGAICEIAVIDIAGTVLLDTLVQPHTPVCASAAAVHHLTDEQLLDAPSWPQVWPQLLAAVAGRRVLAYNADFDRGRVAAECTRWGIDPAGLTRPDRWWCVMRARARVEGNGWRRLDVEHRALGDVRTTMDVLKRLKVSKAETAE